MLYELCEREFLNVCPLNVSKRIIKDTQNRRPLTNIERPRGQDSESYPTCSILT